MAAELLAGISEFSAAVDCYFHEGAIDRIEFDVTASFEEETAISSEAVLGVTAPIASSEVFSSEEEPAASGLKSLSFCGQMTLQYGQAVSDGDYPTDFLDHNVWKDMNQSEENSLS